MHAPRSTMWPVGGTSHACMVDEPLIAACIKRDERAQYAMYKALYPMMMSICTRYERNTQDAASTMNQGFMKILTGLHRRPDHVPFEAWARRVVINTVIDRFRRDRKRKEHETIMAEPPYDATTVNDYLLEVDAEELLSLISALPPTTRHVFNLFALDGYPHATIAEMLSISEGTSKWHVNNARQLLKQALQQQAEKQCNIPHDHERPARVR